MTEAEPSAPSAEPPLDFEGPWFASPFFAERLAERGLSPEESAAARALRERGFLVIEDAFPAAVVERARRESEAARGAASAGPLRGDRGSAGAGEVTDAARRIATDAGVLRRLERLYGRRPVPFRTRDASEGPAVGIAGRPHADELWLGTLPRGFVCAVWVALEDPSRDRPPLVVYPGSHRLPELAPEALALPHRNFNRPAEPDRAEVAAAVRDPLAIEPRDLARYAAFVERLLADRGIAPVELRPARGSAVVWTAGLVHALPADARGTAGSAQLTHVHFADAVYCAPILSNPALGDLYLRAVTDLATGELAAHRWRGLDLPPIEEDGPYKLMLDLVDPRDGPPREVVRTVANRHVKHLWDENYQLREIDLRHLRRAQRDLERAIAGIEGSVAFRLARTLTAPGRRLGRWLAWLRRRPAPPPAGSGPRSGDRSGP